MIQKYPAAFIDLSHPRYNSLSREEEKVFFARFQAGDRKAADRIICSNMKFAMQVARKYQHFGLPLEDLFQEACCGLNDALPKFNPQSGLRFISYAVWWIRQKILMALANQTKTINVPPRFADLLKRMDKARHKIEQKNNRQPSIAEIAEAIKEPDLVHRFGLFSEFTSLDMPTGDRQDTPLVELMEGDAPQADEAVEKKSQSRNIQRLISGLSNADKIVVTSLHGLGDGHEHTLDEVGNKLGVCRERVRQRRDQIYKKLRKPAQKIFSNTPY